MDALFQRSRALLLAGLLIFTPFASMAAPREDAGLNLAFAAAAGTPDEVQAALAEGGKPDESANSAGTPALSLAAQRKDKDAAAVVRLLLEKGANIEVQDRSGQTPLFYAAKAGSVETARVLLEKGASLYQADAEKRTARDAAAAEGQKEIIALMDEHVREQTTAVMQQYEERNKEIAERNKQLEERNKQIEQQHREIRENLARKNAAPPKTEPVKKQALPAPQPEAPKPLDTEKLEEALYTLSYHACGAEYWKFLRKVRQDSELSRDEMKVQQQAHETLGKQAYASLRKDFRADANYIGRVLHPTVSQITDEMKLHATNANRKAEGIGTKVDMDARCDEIASQWELVPPGEPAPPPPKQPTQPTR